MEATVIEGFETPIVKKALGFDTVMELSNSNTHVTFVDLILFLNILYLITNRSNPKAPSK